MAKPIVRHITAFDAALDFTVSFSWSSTLTGNRIVVYETTANTLVYDNTVTSGTLTHTIPANTLTNGTKYYIGVQVINGSATSVMSDYTFFCCYSTPVISFAGLTFPYQIKSASLSVSLSYTQAQSRNMMECIYYLYDSNKVIVSTSDTFYDEKMLSFEYKGLENNTNYYVRAVGRSVDDLECDTGYCLISVNQKIKNKYSVLSCENVPEKGYIKYACTIVEIDYRGTEIIPIANGQADVRGKLLYYDNGFSFDGDFLFRCDVSKATPVIVISNGTDSITLDTVDYGNGKFKFRLVVTNGSQTANSLLSEKYDLVIPMSGMIVIKRVGNVYSISINNITIFVNGEIITTEDGVEIITDDGQTIVTSVPSLLTSVETVTMTEAVPNNIDSINYVSVANGIYDDVFMTIDTNTDISGAIQEGWDSDVILYANFDSTLNASNITYLTSTIDHILVKRREKGTTKWQTIFAKEVNSPSDLYVNGIDMFARAEQTFEYALVPVYQGTEGDYYITTVDSDFDGVFIAERNTWFGTIVGTKCDVTKNATSSALELINQKYPKYIRNTKANYYTGTCVGEFVKYLGCEDGTTGYFSFDKGWDWRNSLLEFLGDGKPKLLKYETGGVWLVNITGAPTDSEVEDNLSSHRQISFEWTQVGEHDSESDLYYANLSDVPSEWWSN